MTIKDKDLELWHRSASSALSILTAVKGRMDEFLDTTAVSAGTRDDRSLIIRSGYSLDTSIDYLADAINVLNERVDRNK